MSIAAELLKLTHSAEIELFVLDATSLGGSVFHFYNRTNTLSQPLVWQGQTYTSAPIDSDGWEQSNEGPLPRPKLRVSNIYGLIGVLNRNYDDLRGAKVTRKRTLARFLDAVNFPGGVNPDADPSAGYPDEIWAIDRKSHQDNLVCEYELASPIDVAGAYLPGRPVIARICTAEYRSEECGYTGPPVADVLDNPTNDPALDRCGQRLSSCAKRFSVKEGLPINAFPGVGQLQGD